MKLAYVISAVVAVSVKQQHKMYQNIDISAKKVGRKIILPTFFYLNKK